MARAIRSKTNCHPFELFKLSVRKNCHPFERLGLSVKKKLSSIGTASTICLKKIITRSNGSGYPVEKEIVEGLKLSVQR